MDIPHLTVQGHDLLATKYFYVGATAILFYDVLLTLPDEIVYIWGAKKNFASYMSLFNRYFSCACAIIVNVAWFHPKFTSEMCNKWAIMQAIQASVVIALAQAFMALRVYAMSGRNKLIFGVLALHVAAQVVFSIVLLAMPAPTRGFTFNIPVEAFHICMLAAAHPTLDVIFVYMCVAFDSAVFLATLVYAFKASQSYSPSHLLRAVARDGIIYFLYIFGMNLLWVLGTQYARLTLKALPVGPLLLLTPVMISRLTLSLYKSNTKDIMVPVSFPDRYTMSTFSTVYYP